VRNSFIGSWLRVLLASGVLLLGGCATSYVVPGPRADMQVFGSSSIQDSFAEKATAPFPATLAFARVQSPAYANFGFRQPASASPSSRYSVITTREAEEDAQVDRLGRLPQVTGVTTINRMLLPAELQTDKELREAAARLHADLLLVYTFDTAFFDVDQARPLSVITLGLSPTRVTSVSTTVSALLMDTRTGYIYGSFEATKKADTRSTSWSTGEAADTTRRDNERAAFAQLLDQVEKTWPKLLSQYARKN
jgi:hypothetical protein